MSYQPQPPLQPTMVGAPAPVAAPTKGKGSTLLGLALIVVGGGAGIALIALSSSTTEETVKKFARAPAGCTTTLEFDKTAEFTFYVETKGHVDDVGGDCGGNGTTYQRDSSDAPKVTLTLTDADDHEISLSDADGTSYDAGDFSGVAYRTARIEEKGTYRLSVASDATDFAIAVGGDPEADSSLMKTGGVIAAAAGVLLGLLVLLLGRRKGTTPPAPAPAWAGQTMPPGGPTVPPVPTYQAPAPIPFPASPVAPPMPPAAPPAPPAGQGWGAPQQ